MQIRSTIHPGQRGAKKLLTQYGDRLVCVRYRYDEQRQKRLKTVELIVEERRKGVFTSLADFAARVNPRAINKRVIESLAAAGAFDTLDSNRARVFAGAALQRPRDQQLHDLVGAAVDLLDPCVHEHP